MYKSDAPLDLSAGRLAAVTVGSIAERYAYSAASYSFGPGPLNFHKEELPPKEG